MFGADASQDASDAYRTTLNITYQNSQRSTFTVQFFYTMKLPYIILALSVTSCETKKRIESEQEERPTNRIWKKVEYSEEEIQILKTAAEQGDISAAHYLSAYYLYWGPTEQYEYYHEKTIGIDEFRLEPFEKWISKRSGTKK